MEGVKRLEAQDARVRDVAAPALAREELDALEHALDAEEVAFGMRRGAAGEEPALAAADLDLERTREVERQRLAGVREADDGVDHVKRYQYISQLTPSE